MPRMKHEEHGVNHFGSHEVDAMEKLGWKIYTDEEHNAAIAAKKAVTMNAYGEEPVQTAPAASATAQVRRGRPPRSN